MRLTLFKSEYLKDPKKALRIIKLTLQNGVEVTIRDNNYTSPESIDSIDLLPRVTGFYLIRNYYEDAMGYEQLNEDIITPLVNDLQDFDFIKKLA